MASDGVRKGLSPQAQRQATALAAGMAAVLWPTLIYEMVASMSATTAMGFGLAESLFLFLHFFSILTNIGIATLMSVTAIRLVRGDRLPCATVYNNALIYILVTCVTYELLLRGLYSPHDLRAISNAIIHDVMPALTLVFWLAYAPREDTRWADALWVLVYPAAYLALTLVAGAFGEPYPYTFLDVNEIGGMRVGLIAVGFIVAFCVLSLVATAVCKSAAGIRGGRSAVV